MPNLTTVTIAAGVPNSGTGTVSTIDGLMADGGQATIGITTGAAVTTSVAGTLQQYLRGLVSLAVSGITVLTHAVTQSGTWTVQPGNTANTTAWKVDNTAALDKGSGTGGAATQRVIVDSSQFSALGQNTMANSQPVVLASNQSSVPTTNAVVTNVFAGEYETVAASQTNQVMGATGAAGDYLSHVIVSPGTAGCGVVTVLDNATAVASFAGGGTTALSNLIPFIIPIGIVSTSGAWKITTGANVTVTAVGNFT